MLLLKDWFTIGGTVVALVFSTLTLLQKLSEARVSNRKQLSDLLSKLSDVNLQMAKATDESADVKTPANALGILNDQRRYIARQAASIAERIRNDVSAPEYLMLAWTFDAIDDVFEADRLFQFAMKARTDSVTHGLALRSYARFLFSEGDRESARAKFEDAVSAFVGSSDRMKHYRGETFERWATHEIEWKDPERAVALARRAEGEFSTFTNPVRAERAMAKLEMLRSRFGMIGVKAE